MKLNLFKLFALIAAISLTLTGCSDETLVDNRDLGYGYIQFKLYKEASYNPAETRALNTSLENLSDAHKIRVEFLFDNTRLSQTLTLSAFNQENAEFGLRTEKLKLMVGDYTILGYTLYDALDEELYITELNEQQSIIEGGLVTKDLTVSAEEKGRVNFTFVKDIEDMQLTRSDNELLFKDISYITLNVRQNHELLTFDKIRVRYTQVFDEEDNNKMKMILTSDSIINIKAGTWNIMSYVLHNASKSDLLMATISPSPTFEVRDNGLSRVDVPVRIDSNQEYIKDYLALYEIWKALDGPNWSFQGEGQTIGCNWDFNRELDLWGNQPGVELHPSGRVGLINISGFGFQGHMPAAIGQLTELNELYLGTHNDINGNKFEPSEDIVGQALAGTLEANRKAISKKYLSTRHKSIAAQTISPALQSAFDLKGATIPGGIEFDKDGFADFNQNIAPRYSGNSKAPVTRADTNFGVITNGLRSLPKEIGNLKNLKTLFIANSTITELPAEFGELKGLTDLEIYNCPFMTRFPMQIAELDKLVAINISQNAQWSGEDIYNGLDKMANSPMAKEMQMFYCNYNNLEAIPASFGNFKRAGMVDFSYNKIKGELPAFGREFAPVQIYFDNNEITRIPNNFCNYNDLETFSANENKLTKFPNIFSISGLPIEGISFAYNEIDGFEGEEDGSFKGMYVNSLNLSNNKFTKFPKALAASKSAVSTINLAANLITEIPEGSFTGENSALFLSIDLTANMLTELPAEVNGKNLPFLYGVDLSHNRFAAFPWGLLNCQGLTVLILRTQRDENGNRCLREWPKNIANHAALRGLYLGSNNLGLINENLSFMIFHLDISDNPNITFYAGSICAYIRAGAYNLYYDRTQDIRDCSALSLD